MIPHKEFISSRAKQFLVKSGPMATLSRPAGFPEAQERVLQSAGQLQRPFRRDRKPKRGSFRALAGQWPFLSTRKQPRGQPPRIEPRMVRVFRRLVRRARASTFAFSTASRACSTASPGARRRTLDYFSDRQWERVRANRSAICLACGPSKGGQKTLKRKLPSGLARLDCRGCKFRKLEDAFPWAQLQRGNSEAACRCLKCLKEVCALECSVCLAEKPISEFNSAAATMPWAAVCAACGAEAKKRRRPERAGWFACRTCETFFPPQGAAKAEASAPSQRCLNCASRGSCAKGKSTCRKCGTVWSEPRGQSDKRQRLRPKCRPGSARRL